MEKFIFYNQDFKRSFLKPRKGETKFGDVIEEISSLEELENIKAEYVIFGIPEDVGIQANKGKSGAYSAWKSFLSSFTNIQSNQFNDSSNCLVLGHLDCSALLSEADRLKREAWNVDEKLGELVQIVDDRVTKLVKRIVGLGKIPIIIGGGHNNAYGNIKGTSLALNKPINVLNIDAHTDLRTTEYRHSGNGFSYAKKENYLAKYSMFGIHKNYTPQYIFDQYDKDESVHIRLFEDLIGGGISHQLKEFHKETEFLDRTFGLEIDCDAIQDFPSSAMTPSGFSVNTMRSFIKMAAKQKVHYLHICEAVAGDNPQIGKTLSYFVSDFMQREK
ncbi:MAG TPA: formimidoylglutamase [Flavobacteriaceae bacterium]|nr:formimidoylglutamase [Flavobacteriaceae bacterium]